MRKRIRRVIILIALTIIIFTFDDVQEVQACSLPRPTWDDVLERYVGNDAVVDSDVIVIGRYVELDDAQGNGIFQVEHYIDGSGPEYILIHASDLVQIENSRNVHRILSNCGGPIIADLNTDETYVYFLWHALDGTYLPTISSDHWYLRGAYERRYYRYDIPTLGQRISDALGHEPQLPDTEAPYPRTTPILITTESRTYVLPVDSTRLSALPYDTSYIEELRRDQYECHQSPCTVYSPNGTDMVHIRSNGEALPDRINFSTTKTNYAVGQRIVFSPTSETVALWYEDELHIEVLWYPELGFPEDIRDRDFLLDLPYPINITTAEDSIEFPVAWSEDGRTLAFSTSDGLWLWDALTTDSEPQLLIPAEGSVPTARYFSPQGRFLAVTNGDHFYNLDLVTGRELPDGYVSPEDRTLLVFDTQAEAPTPLNIMYLVAGFRQVEYYPDVEYRQVQWVDESTFLASISGSSYVEYHTETREEVWGEFHDESVRYIIEEPFQDVQLNALPGIYIRETWLPHVPYEIRQPQMSDFVYESGPGLIEVSADGYQLRVNQELISLESQLSDPIIDVVWLQSTYYYEME